MKGGRGRLEGFEKDTDERLERTVKEEMEPKMKSSEESRHNG